MFFFGIHKGSPGLPSTWSLLGRVSGEAIQLAVNSDGRHQWMLAPVGRVETVGCFWYDGGIRSMMSQHLRVKLLVQSRLRRLYLQRVRA
jgi:hypothetical protein